MRGTILVFAFVAFASACGAARSGSPADSPRVERLRVYDCGEGVVLLVRSATAGAIELEWGDHRSTLAPAADDVGAYAGDGVELAVEGGEATLRVEGSAPIACRHGERATSIERAAAEGALVWAVGNEPGWLLELYPNRIEFVGDYGETRYEGTIDEVVDEGGARHYHSLEGGRETVVRVTRGLCHDGMSGAAFGAEVVVERGGEAYRGCGVFLAGGASLGGSR
jgi:uncharacterized membrane protein